MASFAVVSDPAELASLRDDWDALWDRAAAPYVTQSYAWCATAWEQISAPRGRGLQVLVGREDGRVVLIWPFVTYRALLWRRARPLGPETAEYSDVLVEDGEVERRVAEAWRTLQRALPVDAILLPFVPAGSPLHRVLERERPRALTESTPLSSTAWEGEGDFDAYYRGLDRKPIERRGRRLGELGAVAFEPDVRGERRDALIAWTLRHKEEHLERGGGRGLWRDTEQYRAFLVAAARRDDARGRLLVSALSLDGAPIATIVARVDRRRVEAFLSAYDPAYQKLGPGQLAFRDALRWACERRLVYDLRVGDQPYKRFWTNRHGTAVSYNVANGAWGAAALGARALQHGLRPRRAKVAATAS